MEKKNTNNIWKNFNSEFNISFPWHYRTKIERFIAGFVLYLVDAQDQEQSLVYVRQMSSMLLYPQTLKWVFYQRDLGL